MLSMYRIQLQQIAVNGVPHLTISKSVV
jgi:hypothetical protein